MIVMSVRSRMKLGPPNH